MENLVTKNSEPAARAVVDIIEIEVKGSKRPATAGEEPRCCVVKYSGNIIKNVKARYRPLLRRNITVKGAGG